MENQPFRTNSGRNGAESKRKRREIILAAKRPDLPAECAWQESNLRPCAPEAHALSPELQTR